MRFFLLTLTLLFCCTQANGVFAQYNTVAYTVLPSKTEKRALSSFSPQNERHKAAIHEAGHALVMVLNTTNTGWLKKVSIQQKGAQTGYVSAHIQLNDLDLRDASLYIAISLAGLAAEKAIFQLHDSDYLSDGSKSDLAKIHEMFQHFDVTNQATRNREIQNIANMMMPFMRKHRNELMDLAEELLKHETLSGDYVRQRYGSRL